MKRFILFVLFCGSVFAQTEMILEDLGNGNFYKNDSLYYVFIDTSATPDDTLSAVQSKYFINKGNWEWLHITFQDTGTTYDDTIKIKSAAPYSVMWSEIPFIKDSTWTTGQPAIDDNAIHSYSVWIKNLYKVGIFMTNTAIDTNHVHYFDLQVTK